MVEGRRAFFISPADDGGVEEAAESAGEATEGAGPPRGEETTAEGGRGAAEGDELVEGRAAGEVVERADVGAVGVRWLATTKDDAPVTVEVVPGRASPVASSSSSFTAPPNVARTAAAAAAVAEAVDDDFVPKDEAEEPNPPPAAEEVWITLLLRGRSFSAPAAAAPPVAPGAAAGDLGDMGANPAADEPGRPSSPALPSTPEAAAPESEKARPRGESIFVPPSPAAAPEPVSPTSE